MLLLLTSASQSALIPGSFITRWEYDEIFLQGSSYGGRLRSSGSPGQLEMRFKILLMQSQKYYLP